MTLNKFNMRSAYFHLVCFMGLILFIMGTVQGAGNLMNLVYPDPDSPWIIEKFERSVEEGKMTEEEAEQKAAELKALDMQRIKVMNIKRLAQNLVMIVIAVPLFLIHWRYAANLKE